MHTLLLFTAAFLAGALNAVAGGGTMFTFPALMFTGMPAIAANATSKVGIWPAAMASVFAYRKELVEYRSFLPLLLPISLAGGWLGAKLLMITPPEQFEFLVPWLLLLATFLFAYGKKLAHRIALLLGCAARKGRREEGQEADPALSANEANHLLHSSVLQERSAQPERLEIARNRGKQKIVAALFHLATSVYGGFFGAGIGILMLSMMEMLGLKNIHGMNGLKTMLGAAMHTSAVAAFVLTGAVAWDAACILIIGGILGGYLGARAALRLPQHIIRKFVITVGITTSLYFFMA